MDLSGSNVWYALVQVGIIFAAVLLGNVIRYKVRIIRNTLLPTSVLAGIIIFALKFIPAVDNFINSQAMEVLTYHCLGLGFIALALKTNPKPKNSQKYIVMDTGITTVNTYLIQAIVGMGLTLIMSVTIFKDLFHAAGLLLPMGYGQGTGQALNIGSVFEQFGFSDGRAFGLAIAAIGFLVACIVGVIYMNILKKRGKLTVQQARIADNKLDTNIYASDEAPLSESVDKLTIQVAFVIGIYILVYLVIWALSTLSVNYLGNFGKNTIKPLLWGFNFLFGTLFAILIKKIVSMLQKCKVMNLTYINSYMMNRLSGLFFDVMIVAGIAAIDWQELKGFLWPLLIVCTLGAIVTFLYLKLVCKKIYPDYEYEAFFAMFGMLTGTASTGMILLREIDPNYETPAADNLVLQGFPALIFGAPIFLLVSFSAESFTNALITMGIVTALFIIYNCITLRKFIFKRK